MKHQLLPPKVSAFINFNFDEVSQSIICQDLASAIPTAGFYSLSAIPTAGFYSLSGIPTAGFYSLSGIPTAGFYSLSDAIPVSQTTASK